MCGCESLPEVRAVLDLLVVGLQFHTTRVSNFRFRKDRPKHLAKTRPMPPLKKRFHHGSEIFDCRCLLTLLWTDEISSICENKTHHLDGCWTVDVGCRREKKKRLRNFVGRLCGGLRLALGCIRRGTGVGHEHRYGRVCRFDLDDLLFII